MTTNDSTTQSLGGGIGARPCILVVDDSEENLDILSQLLNDDFDVSVALDGVSALELLTELKVDLVLLDVTMPGIDGYETCRRLKANPATADIPVIFVTAMQDLRDEARGFAVGASDYITKPFDSALVRARVGNYFALRKANRALVRQRAQIDGERRMRKGIEDSRDDLINKLLRDLDGPLARVGALVEELPDGPRGAGADVTALKRAIGSVVASARATMDTCLEVCRLEAGRLTLTRAPADVGALMGAVVDVCRASAGRRTIAVEDESGGVLISVDAARLLRAFRFLIERAIRRAAPTATIRVRFHVAGAWLLVSVTEDGAGALPTGTLTSVDRAAGEPEAGVPGQVEVGASEVALAYCTLIFEAHGGGAKIDDGGDGLPATCVGVLELRSASLRASNEVAGGALGPTRHVLLAADAGSGSTALRAAFSTAGWTVSVAEGHADDILKSVLVARPSIVLVDQHASPIDARSLAIRLARAGEIGPTRVVSLSSTLAPEVFLVGWPMASAPVATDAPVFVPRDLPAGMVRSVCEALAGAPPSLRLHGFP